jgi:hypothetical protein
LGFPGWIGRPNLDEGETDETGPGGDGGTEERMIR